MKTVSRVGMAAVLTALGLAAAAPAAADPDYDFANELHSYGIYGQRDYNAWIAKLMCKRLYTGTDANAPASAKFLYTNLARGTSEQQVYQFMSAGMNYYCPEKRPVLDSLAGKPLPPPPNDNSFVPGSVT